MEPLTRDILLHQAALHQQVNAAMQQIKRYCDDQARAGILHVYFAGDHGAGVTHHALGNSEQSQVISG